MSRYVGYRGMLDGQSVPMETLGAYVRGALLSPPQSFDLSMKINEFPIALNDELDNSPLVAAIHILQLAYAEMEEVFECPSDQEIMDTYNLVAEEDGIVSKALFDHWMNEGLFGTKIVAYAPVDIKNRKEMAAAIYAFGGLYLGAHLPDVAEEQFENEVPWEVTDIYAYPGDGHAFVATGCNRFGVDFVSWGERESLTWSWWSTYGSEAWVVVPEILVEGNHGPLWNVDISAMRQDLYNL